VRPFLFLARSGRSDGFDSAMDVLPLTARLANRMVVLPQTGVLRWYVASIALGAALIMVAVVFNFS
jgi:NADH-quinone oxidoreductase subunit L